jgi:subtilisin-like proprotein convertase family protein
MITNKTKVTLLASAVALALSGCSGSNDDKAPVAENVTLGHVKQWVSTPIQLSASDPNGDALTVSFRENGVTVNEVNGVYQFSHGTLSRESGLTYRYTSLSGEPAVIDYEVSANGKTASAYIMITDVAQDPLANQQWHLRNTGQKAYALSDEMKAGMVNFYVTYLGYSEEDAQALMDAQFAFAESLLVPGEDINVIEAYQQGVTGAGAIAVVVDSGMEIRHEDLEPNVLANRSLNLNSDAVVVTDPTSTSKSGDHGTSVAGLIAAAGWNGLGGRGVAPDTKLIGMNYLGSGKVPQSDFLVHGFPGSGIGTNENIAAFNRSYGITFPTVIAYSEFDEAIESYPAFNLRDGKGALNIKSSGNGFLGGSPEGSMCEDNGANDLGLTCYDGAFEPSQAHPYYLSIGAVISDGSHTSYSTAGANVFVSAPSGEYGRWNPAMVTTDSMTCLNGYSGFFGSTIVAWTQVYGEAFTRSQYPFNYPGHQDNPQCNYTSTMNGTSSAAPNTSGVVSLILSANPSLTWRDVRHILASTSTKVDSDNEQVTLDVNGETFVAHQGWIENAAGFSFNNLYGFGRVNAGEAVKMAKNYNQNLGEFVITDWIGNGTVVGEASLNKTIPDNNVAGATHTIEITEDMTLEAIQFKFDVSNPEMGFGDSNGNQTTAGTDLAIEVISPSGTRSVLLASKQAILFPAYDFESGWQVGYILKNSVMLSNAFYGEPLAGTWTIRLIDTNDTGFTLSDGGNNALGVTGFVNNTAPSVLEGVSIRAFGHHAQ